MEKYRLQSVNEKKKHTQRQQFFPRYFQNPSMKFTLLKFSYFIKKIEILENLAGKDILILYPIFHIQLFSREK